MSKRSVMLWVFLGVALSGTAQAQLCEMDEVMIVNLSRDEIDINNGETCVAQGSAAAIEQCIADEIEAALPPGCDKRFDIFVPGTNAEHGAWRQFNHLFRRNTNRAKLSLRYEDIRVIESWIGFLDPAKYDQGVADARASLINLLDALQGRFSPDQVRVYGHSKGSHSVALVAQDYENRAHMEFYAFAQPGRTDREIGNGTGEIRGRLGAMGTIEKLSPNLVGITFLNDEVRLYRGNDGSAPLLVPERWDNPGFIWQDNLGGAATGSYRIDHHNSYGGDYTDGGNGADSWRDGKGTVGNNLPYCATGDQFAWSEPECQERQVRQRPYFWGTPECEAAAYRMMALGNIGDQYDIGYSGPRRPGTCHQANLVINVDYEIRVRWNLPDRNCRFDVNVAFEDLASGRITGRLDFDGSVDDEDEWNIETGSVNVPIHMNLKLRGILIDRNDDGFLPDCESLLESEFYFDYLTLNFTHPASGERVSRTIMGLDEGSGNVTILNGDNNVAWVQPNLANEELSLYREGLLGGVLKIEGRTNTGNEGNIRKRVHLIE